LDKTDQGDSFVALMVLKVPSLIFLYEGGIGGR
jgi:hypothetical protein